MLPFRAHEPREEHEECEEHEEGEEREENDKTNKKGSKKEKDNNPRQYGKRFVEFSTPNGDQYSLTRHQVRRPRKNLVTVGEYFYCLGNLYQAAETVALPSVGPGYSFERFSAQTVRAYLLEEGPKATDPRDRTRYFPAVQPTDVRVGDMVCFVDVYEPVGADVQEKGVILTEQARQCLLNSEKHGLPRLLPISHRVTLENIYTVGEKRYAKRLAEPGLSEAPKISFSSEIGVENIVSKVRASLKLAPAKAAEEIVALAESVKAGERRAMCTGLQQSGLLFHAARAEREPARFLEKVNKIRAEIARLLRLRAGQQSSAGIEEVVKAIFYCRPDLTPASDVLAATPGLSNADLKAVFESEKAMPENKNNTRLKTWYHDAFEIALMHKNANYIRFVVNDLGLPPAVFGQLAQVALNAKLQGKDIKVGITGAKLFHCTYSPIAGAAMVRARGFIEAV